MFTVFVIVVVVGYVAGITFGILGWIFRRSLKSTAAKIRARLPAEGIQDIPNATAEPVAARPAT